MYIGTFSGLFWWMTASDRQILDTSSIHLPDKEMCARYTYKIDKVSVCKTSNHGEVGDEMKIPQLWDHARKPGYVRYSTKLEFPRFQS
jgi:hypothetical protein